MHNAPKENEAEQEGRPQPLLTRRELAKLCKVSTRTVDNWVASKRIPVLRGPGGGSVRFSWSEVVKSLQSDEEITSK